MSEQSGLAITKREDDQRCLWLWSVPVRLPAERQAMHKALLMLMADVGDRPFRFHTHECYVVDIKTDYLMLQAWMI